MPIDAERTEELKRNYGAAIIDNGLRLRSDFLDEVDWRDRIDPHYTRAWLEFTYGGLFTRKEIDDRTRLLVSVAQFLAMGELEEMELQISAALAAGAKPREILEITLQATTYIGYVRAARGAKLCIRVFERLGRMDEITHTQPPFKGNLTPRTQAEWRASWPAAKDAEEDALREALCEKYGWEPVGNRIRLQAHQGYGMMETYDRIDPHYLQLWFDFIYRHMYPRGVIDERTRLLVMVGVCLALNEPVQLENHMRGAMLVGASPREVLEIIVHSTAYCGMPTCVLTAVKLERIARDLGRHSELLKHASK